MLVLKLKFAKDIRRLPFGNEESNSKLTFEDLRRITVESFNLNDSEKKEFVFQYRDDEEDFITITNDLELEEGIRFVTSKRSSEDAPIVFSLKISRRSKEVQGEQCPFQVSFDSASSCCKKVFEKFQEKRKKCAAKRKERGSGKCGFGKCSPLKIGLKIFAFILLLKLIFFCRCCFFIPLLVLAGWGLKRFLCNKQYKCKRNWSETCHVPIAPQQVDQQVDQQVNQTIYPEVESKQEIEVDDQTVPELPFQAKLRQLEEMGFNSRTRNIEILIRNGGDVLRSVKDLLDKHI